MPGGADYEMPHRENRTHPVIGKSGTVHSVLRVVTSRQAHWAHPALEVFRAQCHPRQQLPAYPPQAIAEANYTSGEGVLD